MPQTAPVVLPAEDVRAATAAGEQLAELAVRLGAAAAEVAAQAAVHRQLLAVDWHGPAAAAFTGALVLRVAALERLAATAEELAGSAARRAEAGGALRAAAGWSW
ncbi:hypothetical protein [Quadrisphaera sp. KR29]|uniref:hypothetical protein n=1 Tax=Quadrisphaera sp. KR29 TaxID=3461391 RepID=UPI004043AB09